MASHPDCPSCTYIFPSNYQDSCEFPLTAASTFSYSHCSPEFIPANNTYMVSYDHDELDVTSLMSRHDQQLQMISDMALLELLECNEEAAAVGCSEGICDFGMQQSCGMVMNHPPFTTCDISGQIIEDQEPQQLKVVKYSAEERKERILRYLRKKSQRNFNKTIKYACRKSLADKRVRIRGRFAAKNDEICQQLYDGIKADDSSFNNISNNSFSQPMVTTISHDEEAAWLQEAISNFMYYHMLPVEESRMDGNQIF